MHGLTLGPRHASLAYKRETKNLPSDFSSENNSYFHGALIYANFSELSLWTRAKFRFAMFNRFGKLKRNICKMNFRQHIYIDLNCFDLKKGEYSYSMLFSSSFSSSVLASRQNNKRGLFTLG